MMRALIIAVAVLVAGSARLNCRYGYSAAR
jgi:hypothetical protein